MKRILIVIYVIKQIKSRRSKHLEGLTHKEFGKCIRINHTDGNPDFFDIESK